MLQKQHHVYYLIQILPLFDVVFLPKVKIAVRPIALFSILQARYSVLPHARFFPADPHTIFCKTIINYVLLAPVYIGVVFSFLPGDMDRPNYTQKAAI
ncbi:hypothetical protein SAMN04488511_101496 [Pedobacter suwonensis]|uniref:Uncharacterized protein n=1 Tax=Pedobacter suwonensis TaxID=332999 RepID=A0A1I0SJI3_9SPHI|nr:hypothetical protein SAMN04488511_101496 [Pedobacter suwonensis]